MFNCISLNYKLHKIPLTAFAIRVLSSYAKYHEAYTQAYCQIMQTGLDLEFGIGLQTDAAYSLDQQLHASYIDATMNLEKYSRPTTTTAVCITNTTSLLIY